MQDLIFSLCSLIQQTLPSFYLIQPLSLALGLKVQDVWSPCHHNIYIHVDQAYFKQVNTFESAIKKTKQNWEIVSFLLKSGEFLQMRWHWRHLNHEKGLGIKTYWCKVCQAERRSLIVPERTQLFPFET